MIIETAAMVGIAIAQSNRRPNMCAFEYITSTARNGFQISSGCSLEVQVMSEMEEIHGVSRATVQSTEGGLDIDVVLDEFEFDSYDRVIQKELALSEQHPSLNIRVRIDHLSARERSKLTNAAA